MSGIANTIAIDWKIERKEMIHRIDSIVLVFCAAAMLYSVEYSEVVPSGGPVMIS